MQEIGREDLITVEEEVSGVMFLFTTTSFEKESK